MGMVFIENIGTVVKGFILAIAFTVVLTKLNVGSALVGFLLAGIIVGYISYGLVDGVINGALMGVAGALILWLLILFKGQFATFSAQLSTYIPLNTPQELIILIIMGAIGGAVGSLLPGLRRRIKRDDKDQKD